MKTIQSHPKSSLKKEVDVELKKVEIPTQSEEELIHDNEKEMLLIEKSDIPELESSASTSSFQKKFETPSHQFQQWYNAVYMWFQSKSQSWRSTLRDKNLRKKRSSLSLKAAQGVNRVKLIRNLSLLGLGMVIMGFLAFVGIFAWFSKDLPQPGKIVRRDGFSTQILDRDGKLLYDVYADERRTPITIDQVSPYLKDATVAIEDKDFYKHQGFDPLTPFRMVYNYVFRGGRVVGGSTLTQQLVKNVLLTSERSVVRKFKEFVLSIQIERQFSKDEILAMYLNEVPYGGTAWGVEAASQIYFNKHASELNLVESSILAGLPQRPSSYSPYAGKQDDDGTPLWKVRALGVLRRMREDGYISEDLEKTSISELDAIIFEDPKSSILAPHFVFYVRDQLEEMFGEDAVENVGYKVTTTLDLGLQDATENIVSEEIEKVTSLNITNGSVVISDPQTGEILTMVGSADYFSDEIDGKFNVAVNGLRQPGSSIKPVTYLTALRKGYTPASMLIDVQTEFAPNDDPTTKPYEPKNYDGKYRGPVSLRQSLGSSLNTTAVKTLANVGVENMLKIAFDMGFPTLEPTKENLSRLGLAVTLGGGEVHLIDTVSAYSAFANGGHRVEPVSILKVEDSKGNVLFEYKPVPGPQVISDGEAFLINDILSDNSARLLAFGENSLLNTGKPIAVKTGTTNDQKDNWTIGWSQTTMVGVWVGNSDNSSMKQVASGITGASPIWRRAMYEAISRGRETPVWIMPDSVEKVRVDVVSGYPEHDEFEAREDYVLKGTLPPLPDPIHTKLKVCRGQNKLASEVRVARGDYEEKEYVALREEDPVSQDGKNRWQDAINSWVQDKEDKFKPPTEYCDDGGDGQLYVSLKQPENERSYGPENIEIEVEAVSVDGIKQVEIWVNGAKRETLSARPFKTTLNLAKGQYEVYAKAKDNVGKEKLSNTVKIGTGGADWKAPEPTATPTPTSAPTSTPILPTAPIGTGGGELKI